MLLKWPNGYLGFISKENENEVTDCKRGKGGRRTSTNCKPTNLVMSEPKQLQLQVEGLSNLMATLKEHEGKRRTVMFIGSMNESGESWCPDCREGLYLFDHVKFPVRIVTSRSFNIHESCSKTGCCSTIHWLVQFLTHQNRKNPSFCFLFVCSSIRLVVFCFY